MRAIPLRSQRRLEVTAAARRHAGRERARSVRLNATSSISAMSGKPPTASNAARATKIAWSPVAMPLSRDRRFIARSTTRSIGCAPSSRTSNRPHSRPRVSSASRTIATQPRGSLVSAWRNSSTRPRAASAPAFIWRARPRGASRTRSLRGCAARGVPSRLPPSTTITSTSRPRADWSGWSERASVAASSSTGMTTEIAGGVAGAGRQDVPPGCRISSALRRNCSPAPRYSRSSGRGWRWAVPRCRRREGP